MLGTIAAAMLLLGFALLAYWADVANARAHHDQADPRPGPQPPGRLVMHHDTGPLRALQHDARQAADQLTALIAKAVTTGIHPPRLLADAAWELWEFAGSPATATATRLGWLSTLDPTAEADAMRRREFLAGAVGAASALLSDALSGARLITPDTITGALDATEGYRALITTEVARDAMGPLLRHAARLRDLAVQTSDTRFRKAC
jgi:hypothetical protein